MSSIFKRYGEIPNHFQIATEIVRIRQIRPIKTVEDLSELPGVGRKTANVVLGNAFNINTGIVVDTHVKRTAFLLGLTKQTDPAKVEVELMKLFPNEQWTDLSHLLIFLGRRTCIARRPQCDLCNLKDVCPSKSKFSKAPQKAPRGTK